MLRIMLLPILFQPPQQARTVSILLWLLILIILIVLFIWMIYRYAKIRSSIIKEADERSEMIARAEPGFSASAESDDLTLIEGIGPKISEVLREAGIVTFNDLASTSPDRLSELLDESKLGMADPATWPEQARLAAAGDQEGLQKLQDRLKGGRKV